MSYDGKNCLNSDVLSEEEKKARASLKVKAVCFGEGNFIRAFLCFLIQRLNEKCGFNGAIRLVQGLSNGRAENLNAADGLYTVLERGGTKSDPVENFTLITSVKDCVDPYADYSALLNLARGEDLEFIFSNTTEFGICYEKEDFAAPLHRNFPNKLTRFLFERYTAFGGDEKRALFVLPLELIENNGKKLKETVLRVAKEWNLGEGFIDWLDKCRFYDTLVDRIVSGYVFDERLGRKTRALDPNLDVCEPFFLLVIEGDDCIKKYLPTENCGLNVIFTDNLKPYRDRKVRILNGAHTAVVALGLLAGLETVEEAVCDADFYRFLSLVLGKEIIPAFSGDGLNEYAADVIKRFFNPFLNHKLSSIALNSISKFVTRDLVSVKDYSAEFGFAPPLLSLSLAALIAFYEKGEGVNDDPLSVEKMLAALSSFKSAEQKIAAVLRLKCLWKEDLTEIYDLYEKTVKAYRLISASGARGALKAITEEFYG